MSYEVVVTREGDNWLADVPELEGAHTYARSLAALQEAVQDVVILAADLPDDATPDLTYTYDVDDELVTKAVRIQQTRAELAQREAATQADTAQAVDALRTAGYSVRDAAALLGLTPGRISQVGNPKPRPAAHARRAAAKKTVYRKAPAKVTKAEPKSVVKGKIVKASAGTKRVHKAAAKPRRRVGV